MRRGLSVYDWQHSLIVLTGTVLGVTIVGSLYWAQGIFIPLALAVFLSFLLGPLVAKLERHGMRRTPAVIVVVLSSSLILGGTGWIVARQVVQLVQELPTFSDNIKAKVKSLREMTEGSGTSRLAKLTDEIAEELQRGPTNPQVSRPGIGRATEPAPVDSPRTVVAQPEIPRWVGQLMAALGSLTDSLATFAMAVVLVVFILINRESLRDRLIRMMGESRMAATTKAIDEAGQRISRFLLMQLVINGLYGLTLAVGLSLLGVEYALLWGFLAAVLRYIPYLGAWISAVPPIVVSLAMHEGWTQPLLVFGLVLLIEPITGNVIEPWLYGQSMGVSEVALLLAAAFWAYLWGPIGLVLSSPLTVCLVVLGKYVPTLEFFDVLLGDEAALEPHVSFYQRLLARDRVEATQTALTHATSSSIDAVYDEILLPALSYAKRDRHKDELTDQDEEFIFAVIGDIVEELGKLKAASQASSTKDAAVQVAQLDASDNRVLVLACPAQDDADRIALEMLRQLMDPAKWDVRIVALETLAAELVESAREQNPGIICISSLPPGGLAHSRYLCKRLRFHLPEVKIIVGRWGLRRNLEQTRQQLCEAGADDVETTLAETQNHLTAWLPVLTQEHHDRQIAPKNIA